MKGKEFFDHHVYKIFIIIVLSCTVSRLIHLIVGCQPLHDIFPGLETKKPSTRWNFELKRGETDIGAYFFGLFGDEGSTSNAINHDIQVLWENVNDVLPIYSMYVSLTAPQN